jgi:hypothetical protein
MEYSYDPRRGFVYKGNDSSGSYSVMIKKDSSLFVYSGYDAFCKKWDTTSSGDEVMYFISLSHLIDKYKTIAIKDHPQVNVKKLIFAENNYLIYKPDTLVFQSDDRNFMTYLFKNGNYLDRNWVHFSDTVNIDFY